MTRLRFIAYAILVWACSVVISPSPAGMPQAPAVRDVSLTAQGTLAGVVVAADNRPASGTVVTLRRAGREISRVISMNEGTFEISAVPSGTYELVVGQNVMTVRVWPANVAPPAAKNLVTLTAAAPATNAR